MLPKFVPIPVPGLVERVTDVISMNPTGEISVLPRCIWSGPPSAAGGGWDAAAMIGGGIVAMGAGAMGMIGVVLATSPNALSRGRAKFSVAIALAVFSISFFC